MGRRVRRPGGARERAPLSQAALDLVRAARGLACRLGEQKGLAAEPGAIVDAVLRISMQPAQDAEMAGLLLDSIASALEALARESGPGGGVHCYRCDSSRCLHSRPREARQVFGGYDPVGRPRWVDLLSYCLDRKDGRVEGLLAGGARVVAVVEAGSSLHREQLQPFGGADPFYRILGQVAAGPFPPRGPGGAAVTFQVVRLGVPGRRARLRLDALSFREELLREEPALADILREARKLLGLLALRLEGLALAGPGADPEHAVVPFLRALARDLESHARGALRRTGHALARVRQSMRPTEKAFPDARTAPDEKLLVDSQEGTLVVLGPRNRVHVFTPQGRQITSLRLSAEAIAGRQRSGRWRRAEAEERGDFRRGLRPPLPAEEPGERPPGARPGS